MVGRAGESQAQSLVGADSALSDGLSLSDFVDRKREMPSVSQSMFFRYWLGMAVVELTLRVDMQPTASLVVLVALDVAGFPLPFVTRGIVRQRIVERGIMALVYFRGRLRLVDCRIVRFLLELPSLLFGGQFFGVGELAFHCSVLRPRQRRLC